ERREDIAELVKYFLRKYAGELSVTDPSIHDEALELLRAQEWPGNVRELENVVRKMLLLAQGYTIQPHHAKAAVSRSAGAETEARSLREYVDQLLSRAQRGELADAHARLLQAAEKELFSRAIALAEGNQARAARWVGVSRLTMREKL